jgi:DNA polymerase
MTQTIPLFLDTETYSAIPITHGTHKYAENAEIIMWQYAIGDGPVIVEDTLSSNLIKLLEDPQYEIVIHNSHFDRTVIRHYAGIQLPVSRIFDTMVCAMAHSLPGSLDELCAILNVEKDKAKDKEGKKLIGLFCKPQKKKGQDDYRATKASHPSEWERFENYGRLDIEAMRSIYKALPTWNYKGPERELWELDQRINDRGVYTDLDLVTGAIRASNRAKESYDAQTFSSTNGEVTSTTRRDVLLKHIEDEYGEILPDMTSSTVQGILNGGTSKIPDKLRDLLEIRMEASKTSVSKYKRVLNGVSNDGRLRGLLQFCGAIRTGRWSGRLFQPQNLPRPSIFGEELEAAIDELKGNADGLL